MSEYVHPEVLVSTEWVKEHLNDPSIKIVEIDVDTKNYAAGHIPGAVGWDWQTQTQDIVRRDIVNKEQFEKLAGDSGITENDTVVLYGDANNWFAAFGFWIFKIYGHEKVVLMNGGRSKWVDEDDRPFTIDVPTPTPVKYTAKDADNSIRAFVPEVYKASDSKGEIGLVDVRSVDEYTGKVVAPPGMSETAQRKGHVPGAINVPWSQAVDKDGTYKSFEALRELYFGSQAVDPDKETIAYCRIGERSSHTWFALKYLLGVKNVKNYDGSWTEYGNLIGAPIALGS